MRFPRLLTEVFFAVILFGLASSAEPIKGISSRWVRLDSSHFSMLTDDQVKGQQVLARFEQMRALFAELLAKTRVNMPEPIEIVAFKTAGEYEKVAPSRAGEGLGAGFFLLGDDRIYFVLNLAQEDSWRAVSYDFAKALLNFNYPPVQPWFDEGFAEYFSSVQLTDEQMKIGGDPEVVQPSQAGAPAAASLVEILKGTNWQKLSELFASKAESGANRHTLYCAQSWLTMHYLIAADKMSAAGTYFDLVENEKLSVDDGIQKAFGMTAAQLTNVIRDYFSTLQDLLRLQHDPNTRLVPMPAPLAADQVGMSPHEVTDAAATALLAEMTLRLPEHREQARLQLEQLINDPKGETPIAHRALGWYYLDKKDYAKANDELSSALALDNKDIWTHFYLAQRKYRKAKSAGQATQGLANMIQDLHIVLDWYPEFAEAYAMLATAQLEGGGVRAATDSIRAATRLAPRNRSYLLEMANVYMAGKNWEAAQALLERLSADPDPQIASAAQAQLKDLPFIKQYGVPSQQAAEQPQPKPFPPMPPATQKPAPTKPAEDATDEDDSRPAEPPPDRRTIQYLKGKLVAVDCSHSPAALVTVTSGGKTKKLWTADYKSLTLIGADAFSCT